MAAHPTVPRAWMPHRSEAHHLRHDERGASIGARIKDDRRAISLCHFDHIERLHGDTRALRRILGVDDLKVWQDAQLAIQRAEYHREICGSALPAFAF